jgi:hypothetical protein
VRLEVVDKMFVSFLCVTVAAGFAWSFPSMSQSTDLIKAPLRFLLGSLTDGLGFIIPKTILDKLPTPPKPSLILVLSDCSSCSLPSIPKDFLQRKREYNLLVLTKEKLSDAEARAAIRNDAVVVHDIADRFATRLKAAYTPRWYLTDTNGTVIYAQTGQEED